MWAIQPWPTCASELAYSFWMENLVSEWTFFLGKTRITWFCDDLWHSLTNKITFAFSHAFSLSFGFSCHNGCVKSNLWRCQKRVHEINDLILTFLWLICFVKGFVTTTEFKTEALKSSLGFFTNRRPVAPSGARVQKESCFSPFNCVMTECKRLSVSLPGFEPGTFGLEVQRAIHCATGTLVRGSAFNVKQKNVPFTRTLLY